MWSVSVGQVLSAVFGSCKCRKTVVSSKILVHNVKRRLMSYIRLVVKIGSADK